MEEQEKLEKQRQRALETLKTSYLMYEASKKDTRKRREGAKDTQGNRIYTDESIDDILDIINSAQNDIIEKYVQLGGKEEELTSLELPKEKASRKELLKILQSANEKDKLKEYIAKMSQDISTDTTNVVEQKTEEDKKPIIEEGAAKARYEKLLEERNKTTMEKPVKQEIIINDNTKRNYDSVKLPSKGECYPNKVKEVNVCQLVAYDENMILSPNLYRTGEFLDHILKSKLIDDISPDDLVMGDRDAIIIWLRANAYGNEYPITMTDGKTGKKYQTVADLSKLKYKKFKLTGDENGYFTYTSPTTNDIIKFRFLTNGDNKKLNKIRSQEIKEIKLNNFINACHDIRESIENNDLFSDEQYDVVKQSLDNIDTEVIEKIEKVEDISYDHDLTNRLLMSTVSINGITDRNYVVNYILNMPLKEAANYRKFIVDNEPGIDYNIKVERPASLGGGFEETFLRLDQFIFINTI